MNNSGVNSNQNQYTNKLLSDSQSLNDVQARMNSFKNNNVNNNIIDTTSGNMSNTNKSSSQNTSTVSAGVPVSVYSQQYPQYKKYQYYHVEHDRARIRFRNNFMYKPNEHPPLNPKTIFTSIFNTGALLAFICFLAIYIIFFSIFGVFYKFSTLDVVKTRSVDATVIVCLILGIVYFYYTLPTTYQDYFISYLFLLFKDQMNDPNTVFEVAISILLLYFMVTIFGFPMTPNEKPTSIELIEFKMWVYLFMLVFIMFFVFILHIEIVDLVYYMFFNWFIDPLPGETINVSVQTPVTQNVPVTVAAPVAVPVAIPVTVPVAIPVAVPVAAPVAVPLAAPITAPGSSGSSGVPGAPGSSGSNGAPGSSGSNGAPGSSGSNGAPGASGSNGAPGSSGSNGAPGSSGSNGAPGTSGDNGAPGTSGDNGAPGTSGPTGSSGAPGANTNNIPQSNVPYSNAPVSNIPLANAPQPSDCCSKIADLLTNKINAVQPQIVYGQPQPIVLQYMQPSVPGSSSSSMAPSYINPYQDIFQTSTLSVPGASGSSGSNLDKLSQMTISQIISGSTQALNQWLNNQTTTQNVTTSCNTSTNTNTSVISNAPTAAYPTVSIAPVSQTPASGPTKSEGFESMYVYDTQSMNTFGDVDINKKKRNSTTSSGDYTTDSYKVISKSDGVQPNTYNQMELEKKVKYWDKNQEKLSVANSTNLKSWSQYA